MSNILPFIIARRYLFAKKSQNVINVISVISSLGIMVGTAALLIVMSVFNGLHVFVGDLYGSFDPDLKIEPKEGKVWQADSAYIEQIMAVEGVESASRVLCDNALLIYQKRQMPAMVLGVDTMYNRVTDIDSILCDGSRYLVGNGQADYCLLGVMLASQLGVGSVSYQTSLSMYTPKRIGKINPAMPDKSFIQQDANICGCFAVEQVDYDSNYAIVSIGQARKLFCYDEDFVSAICIKVQQGYDIDQVKRQVASVAGDNVDVNNKWEQHKSFFKMMEIEKLMAFLILTFIIVIAAFNIIGSLSMLIYEKKDSIDILKSIGASREMVTKVFLFEGWLVSLGGVVIGLLIGVVLVVLQEQFGLVRFANTEDYILSAYPVQLQIGDIAIVLLTVALVGALSAWYPVKVIVGKYYDRTTSSD